MITQPFVRESTSMSQALEQMRADPLPVRIKDGSWQHSRFCQQAVYLEAAYMAQIDGCKAVGMFDLPAIELRFCMHAQISQVNVRGTRRGILIGNGVGLPHWPTASASNSSSNQVGLKLCRVQTLAEDGIAYELDGGSGVTWDQCTAEGSECAVAWLLQPRQARSVTKLVGCHLEYTKRCAYAVRFIVQHATLVIDGLQCQYQPEVLLDASLARNCTINIINCQFREPPVVLSHGSNTINTFGNSHGLLVDPQPKPEPAAE